VGQLAAGIAHDFNNILQSILGFTELLLIQSDLPAKTREPLETIYQQGHQAAQLIQQILDFSRKSVSQKFPVDLGPMLKEAMKLLERTLPESLTLELEIDPGKHRVHADLAQIQQVLTNLVFNARDAMPEGGTLRLHLGRWTLEPEGRAPFPSMEPGEWVVLQVSDTGTGIAPEVLPHLFEPFFTTKQLGRGTGLGLAQVYGIVKQHEGFIDVETEVGRGTTFLVYLPAVLEDGEEPEEQPAGEAPQGQGQTILLVENEEKVLEAAQRILESLGYRVRTARNGQEALQEYERHQEEIALLITDMVMPEMGGLPLVQALRERGSQVRVVVLSGYPLEDGGEQIWGDEVVAWAPKPLSRKQFGEVVGRVLEARPPRGG
jgi:CheY-like chemotaxis protein